MTCYSLAATPNPSIKCSQHFNIIITQTNHQHELVNEHNEYIKIIIIKVLKTVALRPPILYGPEDRRFFTRIMSVGERYNGVIPRVCGAGGKQQICYVGKTLVYFEFGILLYLTNNLIADLIFSTVKNLLNVKEQFSPEQFNPSS